MKRTKQKLKRTIWYWWVWKLVYKKYTMKFLSAKSALDYAAEEHGKRLRWTKKVKGCVTTYTSTIAGQIKYTITREKVKE